MRRPDLRTWVPTLVLVMGCALLLLARRQESVPLAQPLAGLPKQLLGFSGTDVQITADEQRIAGMSSYVLRRYANETERFFSVYVGYYEAQTQGRTIHSPKNCLPGAGWEPISAGTIAVPLRSGIVKLNRYLLGKESATAMVYYWYQGRGRIAFNEYLVKWDLLRDKALHGRSEEALVRLVVPVTGSVPAADSLATAVASEIIPQVNLRLPTYPGRPTSKS